MESYCRKSDKISTSDVIAVDIEEDGSSDKVSSVCSDNDFTSNNDPQQQTVEDNNLNKSVVKITRLSEETTRTFQSHGEYFDLPKHVSSVRFRSDIWPNEVSIKPSYWNKFAFVILISMGAEQNGFNENLSLKIDL